jgi:hypothetical protein
MRGAELVRQEIFGHVPQLNIRRGTKIAKQGLTGPYLARYYPMSINTVARKVRIKRKRSSIHSCFAF